jgi:U3 small nucleolar RNA-associated protein 22
MSDSRFALPTLEESQQLRQAENIVHGNLVQMECEELIHEVSVDYENLSTIEKALFQLRSAIMSAPVRCVCAEGDLAATSSSLSATSVEPITLPKGTTMRRWTTDPSSQRSKTTTLEFQPPRQVDLMGSFQLRTLAKPRCTIDVAVHMPKECFLRKDVLDYRYHDKRLLYVTCMLQHLLRENQDDNSTGDATSLGFQQIKMIGFHSEDDLPTKPIISLKPKHMKTKAEKSFTFQLHFICSTKLFNMKQLTPTSGNLRVHRRPGTGERMPTPRYNCSILEDMYYLRHLQGLHRFSTSLHNPDTFCDTSILLKLWCVKRGYHRERDQMNGFLLTVLLAHLLEIRVVHAHGTPRQMFTTVMEWISKNDFGRNGIAINCFKNNNNNDADDAADDADDQTKKTSDMEVFLQAHDIVMIDVGTNLNLTSNVSINAYHAFRKEAIKTSNWLSKDTGGALDTFDPIFLYKIDFWHCYDM